MNIISKAELKARGWRVNRREAIPPADGYRYDLIAPDGSVVCSEIFEDTAWRRCPDIPKHGLADDYAWTNQVRIAILDAADEDGLEAHARRTGSSWSLFKIALTHADIAALQEGKCIVWGQGEYTSAIYFHDTPYDVPDENFFEVDDA